MAASAQKALPLFSPFKWTPECEATFTEFKPYLSRPLILSKPKVGKPLFLYVSISEVVIASALVREETWEQYPVYFISKVLQGPEARYRKLEKVALALTITARRLRQYFQAHTIVGRTN